MTWTLTEVPADSSYADEITALVDARNASMRHSWGDDDLLDPASVELAGLADQAFVGHGYLAAVEDGRTLGGVAFELPMQDNEGTGWLDIFVRPDERGRGVGSALHDAALDWLRAQGRTVAQASTDQRSEPAEGPGTLAPSTGIGRVAADSPDVRFMQSRGWSLEQVERRSVLPLPLEDGALERFEAEAAAAAGSDYRLVTWAGRTPERWLEQYAYLMSRMSTDPPVGGMDWTEQAWPTTRVLTMEERARAGGYRIYVLAAEHVPTGTLAAFTNFWAPPHTDECVHQGDTLVVPEHRGHRLGMWVKAANLRRLLAEQPGVQRVDTWNAEENEWMLAINVALGFRPRGGAGVWQQSIA